MLYILGGLPATGKTELARFLATSYQATYLRIDTIEQTLKDQGMNNLYDEGYQIAFSIALDNLKNGISVIADSTNPITESREAWRHIGEQAGRLYTEIEVICSDTHEHRNRVETRQSDIPNLLLPTWENIISREYHPWKSNPIVIDTAGKTPEQSKTELIHLLQEKNRKKRT